MGLTKKQLFAIAAAGALLIVISMVFVWWNWMAMPGESFSNNLEQNHSEKVPESPKPENNSSIGEVSKYEAGDSNRTRSEPSENDDGLTPEPEQKVSLERELENHVTYLAEDIGERNLGHYENLNQAADYIEEQFESFGYETKRQTYQHRNLDCHNIIVEIPGNTKAEEILVVGAHYDSAIGTPGANDNGSGVAAMLALAKRFHGSKPERTLRFVAFTNEEPPYFQTRGQMGSWVYATQCRIDGDNIVGAISLETMGYFTDEPDSQNYPPLMSAFYPSTGNFIGFVSNVGSGKMLRQSLKTFRDHDTKIGSEGASPMGSLPGVGWSDHWSFWQEGYSGIMITDTAPFRYPHYHEASDLPDKVNFPEFTKVVRGMIAVIKDLADVESTIDEQPKRIIRATSKSGNE